MKKIILLVFVFLVSISFTYALGCCEKTNGGEMCMFTEQSECAADSKFLPTTCEQTSYCSLGCCYSSDEGRCFKNTPRATCTAEGATWTKDPQCEISQCAKGCCVLGDQAFFVTEVKCKQTASQFPDLEMVYKPDITSESACIASAKSQEVGCCVQEDSCGFTSRANCPVSEVTISGNKTIGFYKDMLCSNDRLHCGCGKQQTTGCIGEDVYWFDSCGNRENIYDADKRKSYNEGFVMSESESCKANPYDLNCGNCEYLEGSVCGDDKNKIMPVGKFTCIGLSCDETYEDEISPNAGGAKKNGESWCVYDGLPGQGRDLVGSRHYRLLCINGEEVVEACKDFREEICVQGVVGQDALDNVESMQGLFGDGDYIEGACRVNRQENCFACNNILSEQVKEMGLTESIIEKRQQCCLDEDVRDCYWQPSVLRGNKEGLDGTCVPQVPVGLKFWGDTPVSQTAAEDKSKVDGTDSGKGASAAEQVCNKADSECKVVYQLPGLAKAGPFGTALKYIFFIRGGAFKGDDEWKIVSNKECVSKDWVVAGNSICKSVGDCGAYFNIREKLTTGGYYNSLVDEDKFDVDGSKFKLKDSDIGDIDKIVKGLGLKDGDKPSFWDKGGTDMLVSAGATMVVSGIWAGSASPGTFWGGFVKGVVPFSGLTDGLSAGKEFGSLFTSPLTGSEANQFLTQAAEKYPGVMSPGALSKMTFPEDFVFKEGATLPNNFLTDEAVKKSLVEQGYITDTGQLTKKAVENARSSKTGTTASVLQTYMWMRTAVQLIDIMLTETKDVTYKIDCQPWQAPSGGDDCESCNEEMKPCSEYRCMSLGKACRLVNKGSTEEKCVAIDANDVNSPIIKPLNDVLTPPYTLQEVEEAGNPGYRLNEQVPPFTPVTLGIELDEPATCKYDVVPGTTFEKMPASFGSSQMLYKQQVTFSLPSELAQPNVTVKNEGEYAMYIRCEDANGNKNKKDYFIKFNVDPSPDLTPPSIRFTSLENEGFVAANIQQIALSVYVDEYADCKWSRRDTEFELMENTMQCANEVFGQSTIYFGTFECKTTLTNLTQSTNVFFIRCKDKPNQEEKDRNVMSESFKFSLKGSVPLNITSTSPEGLQYTNDVTMEVTTARGAENGKASCAFSPNDVSFYQMILFETTESNKHKQNLNDVPTGIYNYHISCLDVAGNEARDEINFEIAVDTEAPRLDVVYIDSMFGLVHLELNEKASCEFSSKPTFAFGEGTPTAINSTVHEISLTQDVFYVKCEDAFGNKGDYVIYTDI
ncbi:MAG: hypothetical protein KKA65_02160 [Nanoarchaeota archaeon]|nr:hypothetical protein [Nanoarchaeota archaeon]